MNSRQQIEALLSESVASAEQRERTTFASQLAKTDGTVVLFGAGRLGRLCARALRRGGVPLRAFCDGNKALHGTTVEGSEVNSPEDAALRFGATSLFVVTIWTGTARESMLERIAYLQSRGCRFVVPYPALVWAHGREETPFHSFDLPSRVLAHREQLIEVGGLLEDEVSLQTFERELRRRLLGEARPSSPVPDQYFPRDLISPIDNEVLVDGGAYTGDTLQEFLNFSQGRFAAYHGVEADPASAARLREKIATLPIEVRSRCVVHEFALHDLDETLSFSAEGLTTSHLTVAGTQQVPGARLDQVFNRRDVSFLKLDVEGAELAALAGASETLGRSQPAAAVCVYHYPEHIWRVPLALRAAMPGHRFALRCHGQDGWESVCYAVPNNRCRLK